MFEGEPQHFVVGDTFPLGCPFSPKIVYSHYFAANPDLQNPAFQKDLCGIYRPGIGLDSVCMSWGHDEYLYHVVKQYLPEEAAYIIRYHSFYACHRDGAYQYLMNERDHRLMLNVCDFNSYDLYSKSDPPADDDLELASYYQALIAKFFPPQITW